MFRLKLVDNLSILFSDLSKRIYCHGVYTKFTITDPKVREINKSSVRDRVLHHLLYTALYPYFDKKFIDDSYSCRIRKGTHKAVNRFRTFARIVSRNNTYTCWVLKCDIKKFFANIDHTILKAILARHIIDQDILWLLGHVIDSFHSLRQGLEDRSVGLPLGNLTSQLLVNIYMNEFDQWVKHRLKIKYYIRYADDFVFLNTDKAYLQSLIPLISKFLEEKLKLDLHPDKVFIKTFASGVDFLGWIHFPYHRVLRTATKNKMLRNILTDQNEATIASYRGMLKHGNAYKISLALKKFQ